MAVNRGRTPNVKLNFINYDAVGWNVAEDENWSLIDAMVSQFIKINSIVGTWKNSTLFTNGDVVVDVATGVLWVCAVTAVSPATGSFSDARAATSGQWTQKSTLDNQSIATIARPEDFGAVAYEDDPSADCTSAVQQAITFAILNGVPLQLAKTYRLTSASAFNLGVTDRLTIRGTGGFYCDADTAGNPFIDINAQPATTVAIVSYDNTATHDFSTQGNLTDCCTLTLAAGHGLVAGMVGRVISDDAIADGNGVEYVGEVVYVGAINANGTNVYLTNRLHNTYSTTPRIVIYAEGARLLVSGITISGNGPLNISAARKWVGIRVTGMVNPIFTGMCSEDTSNAVVQTNGCIFAVFSNNQFERAYNNISVAGITGYGIRDINPEFSLVIANRGHDLRSLYKADTTVSVPANPFSYGAPSGGLLSENQAFACSGPAFDTGQVGIGYVIADNRSHNPYQGNNPSLCGVQAWGKRHSILGHRHSGAGAGILLGTNAPGEDARHVIRDLYYNGSYVGVYCRPTPAGCVFDMQDSEIITTYTFGALSLKDCTMYGKDNRYVLRGTTTHRRVYAALGSALVYDRNATYDFSQVSATISWLYTYQGDALNQIDIQGGEVIAGANAWTGVVFSDIITPIAVAARYILTSDLAPADTDGIDAAIVSAGVGTFYPYIRVAGANAYTSNYRQVTPTVVSNHWTGKIDGCVAESVIRSYVMAAASNSINNIEAGLFKGQELVLINDPTSTQNWQVLAVALNVSLPADATLSPGAGLRFIWNGTLWVAISVGISVTGGITVTTHHGLTGWDDFDDHAQYLTNARFDTRLAAQNIAVLNDVPALGTAYQTLRVNAGATALEYAKAVQVPQARDAATIAPSTHVADTAGLVDASMSLYPIAASTKVALRLFASTAKGIWTQLTDHAFNILVDWKESSTGEPELRIRSAAAAAIKTYIGSAFSIFGGDSGARVGSETVGVVGDLYVSGNVNGPVQGGDYTAPYLIGAVRLWDSGGGHLYYKSGSNPANATDGTSI